MKNTCMAPTLYLHVIEACFKLTIAMFYFCHLGNIWETLQILWKMFLIPSRYYLEKSLLVNKYKKLLCYKKNKSLSFFLFFFFCFFDVLKNGSNGIRIHNHLVCKRTLNHLAKACSHEKCPNFLVILNMIKGFFKISF